MKIVLPFVLLLLVFSCRTNEAKPAGPDIAKAKIELMQVDLEFSEMSVEKGMKAAFIEYIDSNGVLLRADHLPIVGANAIDYLIGLNDSSYTLKWQPQNSFVAKSADLGYTYGLYALHPKEKDTVIYGTYVSIWKKQGDGKWKFVLDTGNQGIGETE